MDGAKASHLYPAVRSELAVEALKTERVGGSLQDLRIPNVMLSSVKRLLVTITTAVNPIKRNTNLKPRSQPGRLNQQAILRAVNPAGSHGKPGAALTAGCHHSQDGVGSAHPERERLSTVRGAQPGENSLDGSSTFLPFLLNGRLQVYSSDTICLLCCHILCGEGPVLSMLNILFLTEK